MRGLRELEIKALRGYWFDGDGHNGVRIILVRAWVMYNEGLVGVGLLVKGRALEA